MLFKIILLSFIVMLCQSPTKAQDKIIDLRGLWRFSIGDDPEWKKPAYDDSKWEIVKVPSTWEDEGFHGYDGYAWYRKSFNIPSKAKGKSLTLILGRIDDADEVYFNNVLIGFSGSFPPDYSSAFNTWRQYPIPEGLIKYDSKNLISVRVFDSQLSGGIIEGEIGIFEIPFLDIDLSGIWKFKTSDNSLWSKENYDDSEWDKIFVPDYWEYQGEQDYDGYAWYRLKFFVPERLKGKKLLLVAGKIDDFDETYINGKLIGTTGPINNIPDRMNNRSEWNKERVYGIPDNLLKFGSVNTIAIRVYDGYRFGGIHQGPISILTSENYSKYYRSSRTGKSDKTWDEIWNRIFN
jgi:hypothetical protein